MTYEHNQRHHGLSFSLLFMLLMSLHTAFFLAPVTADATHTYPDLNHVIDTRYELDQQRMRLVVELTNQPVYSTMTLQHPNRLVIDFKNTQKQKRLPISISSNNRNNIIAHRIRFGVRQKNDLRIVIDLQSDVPFRYNQLLIEPSASNPIGYRLVTDIFRPQDPMNHEADSTNTKTIDTNKDATIMANSLIPDIKAKPSSHMLIPERKPTPPPSDEANISAPLPMLKKPVSVIALTTSTQDITTGKNHSIIPLLKSPQEITTPLPGLTPNGLLSIEEPSRPALLPPPSSTSDTLVITPNIMVENKSEFLDEQVELEQTRKPPKKPHIIIDAGHGGRDPGAVKGKQYEKNITLSYAKALKKRLEERGVYDVTLTRGGDYYVGLRERVLKARDVGGDVFISLHADSHPKSSVRGLSVYTLSETASDKEAARLAARENKESLIDGVSQETEEFEITDLLIDLIQRDTKNKSSILAEKIIEQLSGEVRILKNAHRFAGFRVLTSHDIPSVLVELGYLSNTKDARNLTSKSYQRKITKSIKQALDAYFINATKTEG